MAVSGEDRRSSTMLWVQAATLQTTHETAISSEWFYIPRPSLTPNPSEGSGTSRGRGARQPGSLVPGVLQQPSPASLAPAVHCSTKTESSASSASSRLSASSGQPLVDRRPAWIPTHPPPLTTKESCKQDAEMGEDNMSLASSTHFTVVGGGGGGRKGGGGCCSHSHRLTALVLTMSLIFLAALIAAVVMFEVRVHHRR